MLVDAQLIQLGICPDGTCFEGAGTLDADHEG